MPGHFRYPGDLPTGRCVAKSLIPVMIVWSIAGALVASVQPRPARTGRLHPALGRAKIMTDFYPSLGTVAMPPSGITARPPKYQVLPDLPPEEFEALKDD